MAQKLTRKKGGMKKHGRSGRKGLDTSLSAFVRDKISAARYFNEKGLTTHHNFARGVSNY
jgi:hypothetical protein